ncbi:tetratricopeptide repeat protein [Planktothrix paucivesiculata]|uniref:Tetratricopeptide repeat protein n=1 Tax=Planktothrix paucivesiculata PCC 9631 TaxID=671071 RepID=A0A7Z9C3G6_9CYAN|nr:tetratricopeptide repeat protein [Planktothrix paucivesiculata]VXD24621.1 hypothetical protein PL9631_850046 [Planktothrix paucivesiculata PCC 9631]
MNFLTKVNLNKNIEGSEQFCRFEFDPVPEVIEKHLKLSGWVIGIESPVVGIEVVQDSQLVGEAPLNINRSLVDQTHKTVTGEQKCGFSIDLALENISIESGQILIKAVFEDFKRIPLADLSLSKAEESNQDLAEVQAELHNTREELERLQSQFDEVLAELEQTHWQLHQIQTKQSDSDVIVESDKQVIEVNPEDVQSYYRFLEIQPENTDIWLQLANILVEQNRLEDAIAAYRRLVELSPCAEYYQQLGQQLEKMSWWDEAISYYRRVLEINPNHYDTYYHLRESLIQLGNINEATSISHQLGLILAKKGRINEAVDCFQEVPQSQPSPEKTYDKIWKGLNHLTPFDEKFFNYPTNIDPNSVYNHFSQTSQFNIISLATLGDTEKLNLKKEGLSLANIELIRQDKIVLEELYINSFQTEEQKRLTEKVSRNLDPNLLEWKQGMNLQSSIVETGYVYCICPFSGKILRSNQSFVVEFVWTFYRFIGTEVFYLLIGDWFGSRCCLYFPNRELIVQLYSYPHLDGFGSRVNLLKTHLVSCWQKVKSYLAIDQKEVIALQGSKNLGHYIMNDLGGLHHFSENGLLEKVHRFIVAPYEFFDICHLFPTIDPDKIIRIDDYWEIFKYILDHNYFAVRLIDFFVTQSLADIIYKASLAKSSVNCLQNLQEAKQHLPLILITIRSKRAWLSQVAGIANIITKLSSDYPNLAVVFDGWCRIGRGEDSEAESIIESEISMMQQIQNLIPPNIKTYSVIGSSTYETVVWSQAIDLYITPLATSLTFVVWIGHKMGVTYGNKEFYNEDVKVTYSSKTAEQAIAPVFVPREYITDGVDPNPFTRSYELDWIGIYNEVIKLLKDLNPQR